MKFAYLIMAHNNPRQLNMLLELLDYEDNEIYLHIDKKSTVLDCDTIFGCIKKASIHIYREYDVVWGDMSISECQMFLLSEAVKTYHDYYTLMSGSDLPIKTHDEIVSYFERNKGTQFVCFDSVKQGVKENIRYYYIGRGIIRRTLLKLQKIINFNRHLFAGHSWFSITHDLAVDFCMNKKKMLSMVRWTRCSDECILQSFIRKVTKNRYKIYSPKGEEGVGGNLHLIDWKRTDDKRHPHTWVESDFEEIIASDKLFARKFDENIDFEIIHKIYDHCKGN